MNPQALKLYGENEQFFRVVNETCRQIETDRPEIYETEDDLFYIALEQTYNLYQDEMEQERQHFKRYKVSVEVMLDKDVDPLEFFKIFFTDSNGNQHTLREIHEIEEIQF